MRYLLLLSVLAGCVDMADGDQPDVDVGTAAIPDVRCGGTPEAGPTTAVRHLYNQVLIEAGDPHHRGTDLIASSTDASQTIAGKITYGVADTGLDDENVELFACLEGEWHAIGSARTDGAGKFSLVLTGEQRLPAGMRDLFVSVAADRTGAKFVGLVAPADSPLVVSDVDGTLTASENAYPESLVTGGDTPVQPGAPAALMALALRGYTVVYVTARGDRFTQDTRDWFAAKGFPRGPLRMPSALITLPGDETIEFKTTTLQALAAPFDVAAGFGNRATDVAAYGNVGLDSDRIFIKLPEFEGEVADDLAAGKATGFSSYEDLHTHELAAL